MRTRPPSTLLALAAVLAVLFAAACDQLNRPLNNTSSSSSASSSSGAPAASADGGAAGTDAGEAPAFTAQPGDLHL